MIWAGRSGSRSLTERARRRAPSKPCWCRACSCPRCEPNCRRCPERRSDADNHNVLSPPQHFLVGGAAHESRTVEPMTTMRANLLFTPAPLADSPLKWQETDRPEPEAGQLLIEVVACGVCR